MIRYLASATLAFLTLFATLFGLSKAVAPATSSVLAIIGHLDLMGPAQSQARDEPWCRQEPNETLRVAESYRELCDATQADCGPECQRVAAIQWSPDCSSHTSVSVCVPANPLLRANAP